MEVSVGLYALFFIVLFILIPGVIVRRAFYSGEFSKQFNWTSGGLNHFILSFFLGMVISLAYIKVFNSIAGNQISIEQAIATFDSYFIRQTPTTARNFEGLGTSIYSTYIPVISFLYLFSAAVGLLVHNIVLLTGMDVKTKLFRFSNTWYYLFSGRILQLKKNKEQQLQKIKLQAKYTHLDVLVDEGDKRSLYSGLYFDYDLSHKEANKLEKLYLIKTKRYKEEQGKMITRNIPGEVFTIMGDRILNINATYVFVTNDERKAQRFSRRHGYIAIATAFVGLFYIYSTIAVIFSINITDNKWAAQLFDQSFWYKFLFLFWLNLALGTLTPFKIDRKEKKIIFKIRHFIIQLLITLAVGSLLYYLAS